MKSYDVLIVGAGIVGCACARECALAGLRVCIVEGNVTGGAATAAGMGHIVVMDDSPAQFQLTRYSRSMWQQLIPKLPASAEYEVRGTLWVAADEEEMAEVRAKQSAYSAFGVRAEILNEAEVAEEEPKLRSGLAGGLLVPDDGVIYPPAAADWFLEGAVKAGTTILRGQQAISADNGELRLADGTTLHGERIVLATGTDCSLLPSLPIKKRKGHLLITDRYPGFLRHQLVELGYLKSAHKLESDSVAFNIQPRRTGQFLIGSSRQYGNDDPKSDAAILTKCDGRKSYMPELAQVSGLRVWTGFRAATPDKLPLIGPAEGLTDDGTIWLAAGFEGLGITNAPAAARLLTDQMVGRASEINTAPYLPQRMTSQAALHA